MGQVLHGSARTTAAVRLKEHPQTFLIAYNFAKRLKTLKGLTPCQFICATWQKTKTGLSSTPSITLRD